MNLPRQLSVVCALLPSHTLSNTFNAYLEAHRTPLNINTMLFQHNNNHNSLQQPHPQQQGPTMNNNDTDDEDFVVDSHNYAASEMCLSHDDTDENIPIPHLHNLHSHQQQSYHQQHHYQEQQQTLSSLNYNLAQLDELYLSLFQPNGYKINISDYTVDTREVSSTSTSSTIPMADPSPPHQSTTTTTTTTTTTPTTIIAQPQQTLYKTISSTPYLQQLTNSIVNQNNIHTQQPQQQQYFPLIRLAPNLSIQLKQLPNQSCGTCLRVLSRIYCDHCRLFDDKRGKLVAHCAQCKICRQGSVEFLSHCQTCNVCYATRTLRSWYSEGKSGCSIYLRGEEIVLRLGRIYSTLKLTYPNSYDFTLAKGQSASDQLKIEHERDSAIMKQLDRWYYEMLPESVQDKLFDMCPYTPPSSPASSNHNGMLPFSDHDENENNDDSSSLSSLVLPDACCFEDLVNNNSNNNNFTATTVNSNITITATTTATTTTPTSTAGLVSTAAVSNGPTTASPLLFEGKYITPNFNPTNGGNYDYLKPYCINMEDYRYHNGSRITKAYQKQMVLKYFPNIGINVKLNPWWGELSTFLQQHHISSDPHAAYVSNVDKFGDNVKNKSNATTPTGLITSLFSQQQSSPNSNNRGISHHNNPMNIIPTTIPTVQPSPLYHYKLAHPKYNPILRIRAQYPNGQPILLPLTLSPELQSKFVETDDQLTYPHQCLENIMKQRCFICLQSLSKGSAVISTLSCRHCLHSACLKQAMSSGLSRCPVCKKSITKNDSYDNSVAIYRQTSQLPDQFATVASIGCNDCGVNGQLVKYHNSFNRCLNCTSFNCFAIEVFSRVESLERFPSILASDNSSSTHPAASSSSSSTTTTTTD